MSVYTRFKRAQGGFRQLIELWETTPIERRKRMIEIGMEEDPAYTQKAMDLVMTFHDVLGLGEMELAELVAITPPRMIAFALGNAEADTRERFVRCAKPAIASEIRDFFNQQIGPREIGGAQLKVVEKLRELERKGIVKVKRIPI